MQEITRLKNELKASCEDYGKMLGLKRIIISGDFIGNHPIIPEFLGY